MTIKEEYEKACNGYVKEFCKKQEFDYSDCDWVGGDVGGIISIIDEYYFNLNEIIYDINTNQPKGQILDWHNDCIDFHFQRPKSPMINYKSYCMGLRYSDLK